MILDIEASKLKHCKPALDLVTVVERNASRFDLRARSRDIQGVINNARDALLDFNPRLRVRDLEDVYLVGDEFVQVGVIVKDSTLAGSKDDKYIKHPQLHIDATMAIFSYYKRHGTSGFDTVVIQMPNTMEYKDLYFDSKIFIDFIKRVSEFRSVKFTREELRSQLILDLDRTGEIVKSTKRMRADKRDILNNFILTYAAYVMECEIKEFPEKYVLSEKWRKEVATKLENEPFFLGRHVWRCYFRLCKDSYLLGDDQ